MMPNILLQLYDTCIAEEHVSMLRVEISYSEERGSMFL